MKNFIFTWLAVAGAFLIFGGLSVLVYSCLFGIAFWTSNTLLGTNLGFNMAVMCGMITFILKLIFGGGKSR